jgi:NAD(P)-dependent dehydrogenase (short-subunit alcohol dehydrogenase family)
MPEEPQRVCVLTGAGGKLGAAFCNLYRERYRILAVHRRRAPPAEGVVALQADLAAPGAIEGVVSEALARFGRIDLLVNNAVQYTLAPVLSDKLLSSLEAQFAVNVFAPLRLAAEVARRFWTGRAEENQRANRNLVNVSSLSGVNVYGNVGQSAYSATKSALNMLTRHLAVELASLSVRVNAVAPNGFPRIVSTEAVAASIVQLDQGAMTGKLLLVDRDGERFA